MSKGMGLINQLKAELSNRFKMKDLGDIHYILKMEVARNREQRVMTISQRKYIAELVAKYKLVDSAPVMTPQFPGLAFQRQK
ncbi:Gag-pol Polyprotein [Phytophthora megakarya]|uniref:Gag-pol Polyprotein n=1 Tax=Phytophthora megakarya TaxID=4795 RepID=A0A225V2W5_9STRA|nr:Gag-pol Polyprotein [Phytophthora megakarya]